MTMTKNELEVLHKYMDSCSQYLEFGSGESTVYAASLSSITRIDSVESSKAFVDEDLKCNGAISDALASGKLLFHFIDIGETCKWGRPVNNAKRHLWPNYSLSVYSHKSDHDLVLIDGRFRVSCTLSSLLNTPERCIIMIHDFWNREEYHLVLRYLDVLETADTLAVFSKKRNIDSKKVSALISKYQYLPDDKTTAFKIIKMLRRCVRGRS